MTCHMRIVSLNNYSNRHVLPVEASAYKFGATAHAKLGQRDVARAPRARAAFFGDGWRGLAHHTQWTSGPPSPCSRAGLYLFGDGGDDDDVLRVSVSSLG